MRRSFLQLNKIIKTDFIMSTNTKNINPTIKHDIEKNIVNTSKKIKVNSPYNDNVNDHDTKFINHFLSFINKSPSPFHAVKEVIISLKNAGFNELNEKSDWKFMILPNKKYYITRNKSAIIAFAVGGKYEIGNGFHILGAHTDSPCLKIKPISKIESSGWLQVGVECYGGALFHTWFDRDLGIAGRVFVNKVNDKKETELKEEFVFINKPILRIPTLAIHLDRDVSNGFNFNKETHLRPILATSIENQLNNKEDKENNNATKHHAVLLQLLANELNILPENIHDFELCLFDTQGANIGGVLNEFIFSPRLDNLCCSYLSIHALISSLDTIQSESNIRMVALFDNEEIGSNSLMGAGSNFLETSMQRICNNQLDAYYRSIPKSILISADMAHGVHPNYSEKHEINHRPMIHKGPVIKYNVNQRYATTSETAFLLKQIASNNNINLQEFVVRQDTSCGSTIGPILATNTGIRTIDVGLAQLSMHSIREMCGIKDLLTTFRWFKAFYKEITNYDKKLNKYE